MSDYQKKMDVEKSIALLSDFIDYSRERGRESGGFEDAIETLITTCREQQEELQRWREGEYNHCVECAEMRNPQMHK